MSEKKEKMKLKMDREDDLMYFEETDSRISPMVAKAIRDPPMPRKKTDKKK